MENHKEKLKKKIQPAAEDKPSNFKPRRVRARVIGIGGGGISIISEMANPQKSAGPEKKLFYHCASFAAVDTDARVFQKAKKTLRVLQLGEKLTKGSGTGMDVELAQRAAEEEKERLIKLLQDQDIIILVGCLGGGVGSGVAPILAKLSQEQKNITIGIFTLPFGFEGEKKMALAKKAAEKLRESLSGVVVVPNEKIFQLVDKKTPLKKSLSALNQVFSQWLGGLLEIILRPSLINIDFADLRTILEGKGLLLFFGQAITQGANKAEEAIKLLLNNQFWDGPPKSVSRVLFNITGGRDLSIKEVEAVSQSIFLFNPKAKIIFGLTQDQKYSGKLKVVMLAAGEPEKKRVSEAIAKQIKKTIKVKPQTQKKTKSRNGHNGSRNGKLLTARGGIEVLTGDVGPRKDTIRQTALEVKEAEQVQQQKELAQEAAWEIPAFLKKRMQ
jgi:cell division protein FtsZ